MKKYLLHAAFGLLLMSCGGSAADKLRGGTWKVAKWDYSADDVFDGHANMPATKKTSSASAENVGTLAFTGGTEVGGGNQLTRTFTKIAARGTTTAGFSDVNFTDLISWDPKGFRSEEDMVTIYDTSEVMGNGAWTVTGGGSEVTLSRSFQTDASPTQHLVERMELHLKR